ncbi:MAG: glycosyltransferase, partial [Coriobacteriales bacterium]|nr:glycosyltransferase [Coriobacteriales bacterium]
LGAEVVYNHADYRLMSAHLLQALASYEEVNLFLRGLIPLVGFPSCEVYYERHERMAGTSHYPLSKMLALALDGVTSLSTRPIHMVMVMGFVVTVLSVVGIVYALVSWALGRVVSGWTSMVIAILFLGGVQLLSIGIIGEYVGKTYMESKHRPRYLISEREFGESEPAADESR